MPTPVKGVARRGKLHVQSAKLNGLLEIDLESTELTEGGFTVLPLRPRRLLLKAIRLSHTFPTTANDISESVQAAMESDRFRRNEDIQKEEGRGDQRHDEVPEEGGEVQERMVVNAEKDSIVGAEMEGLFSAAPSLTDSIAVHDPLLSMDHGGDSIYLPTKRNISQWIVGGMGQMLRVVERECCSNGGGVGDDRQHLRADDVLDTIVGGITSMHDAEDGEDGKNLCSLLKLDGNGVRNAGDLLPFDPSGFFDTTNSGSARGRTADYPAANAHPSSSSLVAIYTEGLLPRWAAPRPFNFPQSTYSPARQYRPNLLNQTIALSGSRAVAVLHNTQQLTPFNTLHTTHRTTPHRTHSLELNNLTNTEIALVKMLLAFSLLAAIVGIFALVRMVLKQVSIAVCAWRVWCDHRRAVRRLRLREQAMCAMAEGEYALAVRCLNDGWEKDRSHLASLPSLPPLSASPEASSRAVISPTAMQSARPQPNTPQTESRPSLQAGLQPDDQGFVRWERLAWAHLLGRAWLAMRRQECAVPLLRRVVEQYRATRATYPGFILPVVAYASKDTKKMSVCVLVDNGWINASSQEQDDADKDSGRADAGARQGRHEETGKNGGGWAVDQFSISLALAVAVEDLGRALLLHAHSQRNLQAEMGFTRPSPLKPFPISASGEQNVVGDDDGTCSNMVESSGASVGTRASAGLEASGEMHAGAGSGAGSSARARVGFWAGDWDASNEEEEARALFTEAHGLYDTELMLAVVALDGRPIRPWYKSQATQGVQECDGVGVKEGGEQGRRVGGELFDARAYHRSVYMGRLIGSVAMEASRVGFVGGKGGKKEFSPDGLEGMRTGREVGAMRLVDGSMDVIPVPLSVCVISSPAPTAALSKATAAETMTAATVAEFTFPPAVSESVAYQTHVPFSQQSKGLTQRRDQRGSPTGLDELESPSSSPSLSHSLSPPLLEAAGLQSSVTPAAGFNEKSLGNSAAFGMSLLDLKSEMDAEGEVGGGSEPGNGLGCERGQDVSGSVVKMGTQVSEDEGICCDEKGDCKGVGEAKYGESEGWVNDEESDDDECARALRAVEELLSTPTSSTFEFDPIAPDRQVWEQCLYRKRACLIAEGSHVVIDCRQHAWGVISQVKF